MLHPSINAADAASARSIYSASEASELLTPFGRVRRRPVGALLAVGRGQLDSVLRGLNCAAIIAPGAPYSDVTAATDHCHVTQNMNNLPHGDIQTSTTLPAWVWTVEQGEMLYLETMDVRIRHVQENRQIWLVMVRLSTRNLHNKTAIKQTTSRATFGETGADWKSPSGLEKPNYDCVRAFDQIMNINAELFSLVQACIKYVPPCHGQGAFHANTLAQNSSSGRSAHI